MDRPVPGGLSERTWTAHGRTFGLLLPSDPEALLDDPDVLRANEADDRMPYWAWSWPVSNILIDALPAILPESAREVEEIGCGLGLVALAAAALRPNARIVACDHDETAVALLRQNAERNGLANLDARVADWSEPTDAALVLAADVLYEDRFVDPLLERFRTQAEADASIWLADPGRPPLKRFLAAAGPLVRAVATEGMNRAHGYEPGEPRIVRLRRR